MEKKVIEDIVKNYLKLYPNENERLSVLLKYLLQTTSTKMVDWNNTQGHLTAGGFLYCKQTKKFLVLYHKDLKMYLYPGGHCEKTDNSTLDTAIKEVKEETGITDIILINFSSNKLVPVDIDTHEIPYNKRVGMPKHYHFDFRYLFAIDKEQDVKIDAEEMDNFKWIDINELKNDKNYGKIIEKLQQKL